MSDGIIRDDIDLDIARERARQVEQWGVQLHPNGTGKGIEWLPGRSIGWLREYARDRCKSNPPESDNWLDILLEEVFEAAAEADDEPLRQELVQVAAVVKAWIETIDDRGRLPAFVCEATDNGTPLVDAKQPTETGAERQLIGQLREAAQRFLWEAEAYRTAHYNGTHMTADGTAAWAVRELEFDKKAKALRSALGDRP